jgi:two-component system KDP operon response regulator KdpE
MSAKAAKILIVDDEPQIRTLLRRALSRAGYRVIEAANAREALAAKRIACRDSRSAPTTT